MSKRTQKNEFYLAVEQSGFAYSERDLGNFSGYSEGSEIEIMLKGKGPHKPDFSQQIVSIHSLMIYTDLIEYTVADDKKSPLLRCFSVSSIARSWRHYNIWTANGLK